MQNTIDLSGSAVLTGIMFSSMGKSHLRKNKVLDGKN
jgi:hypothetical protein